MLFLTKKVCSKTWLRVAQNSKWRPPWRRLLLLPTSQLLWVCMRTIIDNPTRFVALWKVLDGRRLDIALISTRTAFSWILGQYLDVSHPKLSIWLSKDSVSVWTNYNKDDSNYNWFYSNSSFENEISFIPKRRRSCVVEGIKLTAFPAWH